VNEELIQAFRNASIFLIGMIKAEGWVWSSNYLREHVRCATGLKFSNTISPVVLREVAKRYPAIAPYIEIKPLRK